jgi:hypothetical protein
MHGGWGVAAGPMANIRSDNMSGLRKVHRQLDGRHQSSGCFAPGTQGQVLRVCFLCNGRRSPLLSLLHYDLFRSDAVVAIFFPFFSPLIGERSSTK